MRKTKVVIGYPPIASKKGTPLLSQNRQFQYFNSPTYIYPMVPAYSASHLKKNGFKVYWMDGIAEKKTYAQWADELTKIQPDYLLVETKSPIIKTHWRQINDIKKRLPNIKLVWVGDHVTSFPLETFENSDVDYIIKGGDYDFVIVNLLKHIYQEERLESGIFWRQKNKDIKAKPLEKFKLSNGKLIYSSGPPSLKHNLDELPFVDRELTKWWLYAYENGNYKYTPATYMYSGRDCWYNRCTFCVWDHTLNPIGSYRSFSPKRLFAEVKYVVDKYAVKEIFDDAGTFFIGQKLIAFCNLMIKSGYNKKVKYGCNMRLNALQEDSYDLMKQAGFRFILYGMESANQKTLDRLKKGLTINQIIAGAQTATKAGLEPHVTIMLGYPWESYRDAKRTIQLSKQCFKKGYFNTMQSTIVIPYPGTPLYRECKENGWLITNDYDRFDMREPVMKIPFSKKRLLELEQDLYAASLSPHYIFRQLSKIRSIADIKYLFFMAKKFLGHLIDFHPQQVLVKKTSTKYWHSITKKLFTNFFSRQVSTS